MKCPKPLYIISKRIKIKTYSIVKYTSGVLYYVEMKVERNTLKIGYRREVGNSKRKLTTDFRRRAIQTK